MRTFVGKRSTRKRPDTRRSRRRGVSLVYLALGLTAFIGATAMSVDVGHLYYRSAEARKAADAAALAGAMGLEYDAAGTGYALTIARYYATRNGYDHTKTGVIVNGYLDTALGPGHYSVHVRRTEPLFFARIFGLSTSNVGARATALYESNAPLDISGTGSYGANGPMNLSVFGPYAMHSNGDAYSPLYLNNGQTNPQYARDGYDFMIDLSDYRAKNNTDNLMIEIFDPDTYNASGGGGVVEDAKAGYRVDEIRTGHSGRGHDYTDTRFSLYWDALNTPNNPADDTLLQQVSYGNASATDMKWVSPTGFNRNITSILNSSNAKRLRINVKTTDGSSENGFNLRAGAPHNNATYRTWNDTTWSTNNANKAPKITASGRLPINFNDDGIVTVTLGEIPTVAAGGQLTITKFDTDVGSKNVTYRCSSMPGKTFPGVLSGNDEFKTDILTLPTNYTKGTWTATYEAGLQDTSVWEMTYSNYSPGTPGRVKLVR